MISINTKSRTTSLNLFYVAISRARLEARVYTDAIAGLPAAIAKRYDKTTALSLQNEREVMRLQKPHALQTIADGPTHELGRASCRQGVSQVGSITGVAVTLKKKAHKHHP